MKKLIAIGGVLVALVVVLANFGICYEQVENWIKGFDRETAFARVNSEIGRKKSAIKSLETQATKYEIEAQKLEYSLEDDQKRVSELQAAIKSLSTTAKAAGLPSPNQASTLTQAQAAIKLRFNDKEIGVPEIYETLTRWDFELKKASSDLKAKAESVARLRSIATEAHRKTIELQSAVDKLAANVNELSASKQIAKANAELATVEATIRGISTDDQCKALDVIRDEILEYNAKTEVINSKAMLNKAKLDPADVLSPSSDLDRISVYWD